MDTSASKQSVTFVLLLFATAGVLYSESRQGRIDELPAAWGDLDTWSRYDSATEETELGLGLRPSGPQGTMLVAFSAQLKGRAPSQSPREVRVHASAGTRANASQLRSKTLKFVLHAAPPAPPQANGVPGYAVPARRAGESRYAIIDLSSRLGADDPTPGAHVNFATAHLAPAEFVRIAQCGHPTAMVLGVDVGFRPDQLKAIRAFADRIFLKLPAAH